MRIEKVNLTEKFSLFNDQWSPRQVAVVDEMVLKIAKIQGEFVWHKHDEEDELFIVYQGSMTIHLRDGHLHLSAGEMVVIPRRVEHMPVAENECQIILLERKGTLNTGNVRNERTVNDIPAI